MDLARQPHLDHEADDRHPEPDLARNAVMESVPPAPLAASAAMLSCCSMIAAPIDAKPMTSAMIWRCFELRRSWNASAALTPFLFLAGQRRFRPHAFAADDQADDERAQRTSAPRWGSAG